MQRIIGFVVAVVVAIVIYNVRSSQRDAVDAAVDAMPERMIAVMQKSEGFATYKDYIADHADKAHDHALSVSYEAGGRRRSPKFDSRKYALAFVEDLVTQGKLARTDPKLDLFLRQLQIDVEKAAERGEFD
ncbi:MAG: hypothetical protein HZB38_17690 [Planctomycetes bacterium]|nr:hypothetical protein [Planctomycetota bacterium]